MLKVAWRFFLIVLHLVGGSAGRIPIWESSILMIMMGNGGDELRGVNPFRKCEYCGKLIQR